MSYVYTLGGNVIQSAGGSYQDISFSSNLNLAWPTQFQDVNEVTAAVMYLTPLAGSLTVFLPNATLNSAGQVLLIINPSATNFTLSTFGPSHVTFPVNAGTSQIFILRNNTTSDGQWGVIPAGGGVVAVTSVAAVAAAGITANNLSITGSPITSSGTFTFTLTNDLASLANFGSSVGFAYHTGANTYALGTLSGTANQITITPGGGGNFTFSLPSVITGINNLTVASLNFSSNVITTQVTNQELLLSPNGTGRVQINNTNGSNVGLDLLNGGSLKFYGNSNNNSLSFTAGNRTTNSVITWPTTDPVPDQVMIAAAVGGGAVTMAWETITTFGGPSTVNALARYADVNGSLKNSNILLDDAGNLTQVNSISLGTIQIGVVNNDTISTSAGSLYLTPNGTNPVISSNSFTILSQGASPSSLTFSTIGGYVSFAAPSTSENTLYFLPEAPPNVNQIQAVYKVTAADPVVPEMIWVDPTAGKNLILNGAFNVWQRNTVFTNATFGYPNNNNTYTADGWKLLSNGNNIVEVIRVSSSFHNSLAASGYALTSEVITANTKWGFVNFLNNTDTDMIRGRSVIYQLWNMADASITNLKACLIQWVGTPDALTSNIISTWNANNVPPTLVADWHYIGDPINLNKNDTTFVQTISTVNSIPIDTANLGLFIWCDSTSSNASDNWDIACVKLELGQIATPFIEAPFYDELQKCYYYFQTDLDYGVALGTANTAGTSFPILTSTIPNGIAYARVEYKTKLFSSVLPNTYPILAPTNDNRWTKTNGSLTTFEDMGANSANPIYGTTSGFVVQNNSGAVTLADAYTVVGHWYVDAGFNS